MKFVRNRAPNVLNDTDANQASYRTLEDTVSVGAASGVGVMTTTNETTTNSAAGDGRGGGGGGGSGGGGEATEKVFTIDEAVEKIGFGRFQFKLSMLTGLAWVKEMKMKK